MRHLISMKHMSNVAIYQLFHKAEQIQKGQYRKLDKQMFAANLFLEPSTRTKNSFIVAERKLGLEVLDFTEQGSSLLKGESLYDTARTFESIGADVIVLRQEQEGVLAHLTEKLQIPIINAGDGSGEHPTQCLLDLYTIFQEFHSFKGLKVVIAGDIRHSRVARSNAHALRQLGADVAFVSPEAWRDDTISENYISVDEAVEFADVMMLLRIQRERHSDKDTTQEYLQSYGLTVERERKMKEHAIVLHPAPVNRGVEIADELVEAPRSRIFKQMENGVTIRMAILSTLLEGEIRNENSDQKYQNA
ncbi:aspartate carbamoyltransferase catalytic subunit [Thalassobacillus hwangdonensis]|uniref:Aspartate carbamoyltransferase n=1 Tax=Thalassobacillus hwangdonensis TaxID=546108 RepID=A0ABW3KWR1_9BACI